MSTIWTNLQIFIRTKLSFATEYHPQSDGTTERYNQEIEAYLSIYCTAFPTDWVDALPILEFTHNSRRHSDRKHSPFELLLVLELSCQRKSCLFCVQFPRSLCIPYSMSRSTSTPDWHVLDFSYDDERNCALTIYVDQLRFYITAENAELDHETEIGSKYQDLFDDFQREQSNEPVPLQSDVSTANSDSGIDVQPTRKDRKAKEEHIYASHHDAEEALQKWMVAPLIARDWPASHCSRLTHPVRLLLR